MVREHEGDSRWGAHAHAIAHSNMWKPPSNGGHDDKVCSLPVALCMTSKTAGWCMSSAQWQASATVQSYLLAMMLFTYQDNAVVCMRLAP